MKKLNFIIVAAVISTPAISADFQHCKKLIELPPVYADGKEGFPASFKENGELNPHSSINFKREENDDEIIETLELPFDDTNPYAMKTKYIVKRNKDGSLKQIVSESKFDGLKTSSGLGTSHSFSPMNTGGLGGLSGMSGASSSRIIVDIEVVDGKCFPKRQVMETQRGSHTHRSFLHEPKLCHDIMKLKEREDDENSRLSKLKKCYQDYQDEVDKVLGEHVKRNEDLYDPMEDKEAEDMYPGANFGSGFTSTYQGGAFASSIDNIIKNENLDVIAKNEMLRMYCNVQALGSQELFEDEELFDKAYALEEPATSDEDEAEAASEDEVR